MNIQWMTFTTFSQRFATQAQSTCTALLDFTAGSIELALGNANVAIGLWIQFLVQQVMSMIRAATSVGPDLDSWMADFGFLRLPAVTAVGFVQFSRFSTTTTALVPVGSQVKSLDGTQTFTVVIDTTNSFWNNTLQGYTLAVGVSTVNVPVNNAVAALAGNCQANTVTLIASAISGIDTVTNAAPMVGGVDAESDTAFLARFPLYIASFSKATAAAIGNAIMGVQQGLTYALTPNVDSAGNYKPGNFVVTVDDGTGAPGSTLLNAVYAAVDAVRGFTTTFNVQAPTVTTVDLALTITAQTGYLKANVQVALASALASYLQTLPIGVGLYYTQLAKNCYDLVPGVATVTGLTANSGTADIIPAATGALKPGVIAVN